MKTHMLLSYSLECSIWTLSTFRSPRSLACFPYAASWDRRKSPSRCSSLDHQSLYLHIHTHTASCHCVQVSLAHRVFVSSFQIREDCFSSECLVGSDSSQRTPVHATQFTVLFFEEKVQLTFPTPSPFSFLLFFSLPPKGMANAWVVRTRVSIRPPYVWINPIPFNTLTGDCAVLGHLLSWSSGAFNTTPTTAQWYQPTGEASDAQYPDA